MRSKLAFVIGALGLAAGCAKPDASRICSPLSSWTSPTYTCAAVIVAPPPAPAPAPPPPEPEPEKPAPKAVINTEKIDLAETVQFDSDAATLVEKSKTLLDEVAVLLNAHPELTKIQVEGYTDSRASKQHNQKLSAERAVTVKAYLVGKGVDAGRMTTKGFGADKPVADNNTDEGRFQNRRVDFRILERKP